MKRSILAAAALAAAAVGAWQQVPGMKTPWGEKVTPENAWREYPRPQMARANWTNLNGLWQYAVTKDAPGCPAKWDGEILVPFVIESSLSGVGRLVEPNETLWYKRSFDADVKPGERLLLHFEQADFRAMVYVNGRELCVPHEGGAVLVRRHRLREEGRERAGRRDLGPDRVLHRLIRQAVVQAEGLLLHALHRHRRNGVARDGAGRAHRGIQGHARHRRGNRALRVRRRRRRFQPSGSCGGRRVRPGPDGDDEGRRRGPEAARWLQAVEPRISRALRLHGRLRRGQGAGLLRHAEDRSQEGRERHSAHLLRASSSARSTRGGGRTASSRRLRTRRWPTTSRSSRRWATT